MKIKSDYARLDVTTGRRLLERKLAAGDKIEVTIRGFIDPDPQSMSHDDGVSIEFLVNVTSVEVSVT